MPDYHSILQEFIWQTMDIAPKYPRMMKFLEYWDLHIEASIHKVTIYSADNIKATDIKTIDKYRKI